MNEFVRSVECREIILIGETSIYNRIQQFLRTKEDKFLISFFKSDNTHKTFFCSQKRNEIRSYESSVYEELMPLADPTLVINCGCYYIYPGNLINKKNLTFINFHNGLLPAYRGLNIPSWVIYNGERECGVTWHRIREKVDAGEVLKRASIAIKKDEKAYELCRRLFAFGYDLFLEFWEQWENGNVTQYDQENDNCAAHFFYYGRDIPNNGVIDLCRDKPDRVYNVLRACDYGKLGPFPPLVLMDKDKRYLVSRYWKGDNSENMDCGKRKVFKLRFNDTFLNIETMEE